MRLGALVLVAASVCGCTTGSRSSFAPEPAPGVSTSTTSTTSTTIERSAPKLTTNGSAPRVALRLTPVSGSSEEVAITTDLAIFEDTGPQTVDPPPVVQIIRVRVGDVAADGGAAVSFGVTDVTVGRGNALTAAEQLTYTAELAKLVGIRGSGRLSPSGRFDAGRLSVPDGIGPSTRAQVQTLGAQVAQLAPSLPADPVGVGASWTAEATTVLGGATVVQSTTTTVTAIDGPRVSYTSTTRSRADRQPLTLAGLPAGTSATLASSELTGTGSGVLDLTRVTSASTTQASGTQVVEVRTGDGTVTSTAQRLTVATRSEPRP